MFCFIFFQQNSVVVGYRYVIYIKDGKILRAGGTERTGWFISLRDEIRIIRKSVALATKTEKTGRRKLKVQVRGVQYVSFVKAD